MNLITDSFRCGPSNNMIEENSKTYQFLEGGGEMGRLTREFKWASTSVGPVSEWAQSLRTMVDVILHSQVPMLLWWGDDLIQFYNDAYRPSLGEPGKHPTALGQPGAECWPETWETVEPLIDRVRAGGSIWRVDQLIPINRNGRMEDVYWTFGYSPVRDENGSIRGVLVICNETTKEVKAIQRIGESERTLRTVVLNAPVGICILDGDPLHTEIVNDIFLELVGKSREDFETKPYWDNFPELRDMYIPLLDSDLSTGTPFRGREQRITLIRDGAERVLYLDFVIARFTRTETEGKGKVMILAIDVTDKVLARMKIEESEQRYKTLIAESTVAIALYVGRELRIQYVNEIMTSYWGKDLSVEGKTLSEALPELHGQSFLEKLDRVFTSGESYVGKEEPFFTAKAKGQPSYFNFIYKPLRDSTGRIYGIHNMAMDVTEQVLARKKVEQSEAMLRNIILKAPVAMCILKGPAFVVEIANERMFRLWGKDRDELIHRPIFEGLPEARHQGFEEILARVYTTGESFTAEAVRIALPRNGTIQNVFVNFLYEAYREADGTISGVMAVASDVTEQAKARHRIEELVEERTRKLAESNINLKRSNDELAQFAYIASHDLQEPARKISTFTEMLKKSLKVPDERTKTLLQKIESSSTRMLALIRGILTYSQLRKEQQQVSRIDLNQVVRTVMEDFELLIEEKNAIIEWIKLPVIAGISLQINQLFANLISNALKFSHKDRQPRITITCTVASQGDVQNYPELEADTDYYIISFRDNGIGFNQKNARQIFDIFQRLHGKTEYEGTGIGLAMCKKIAQNHYGHIVAESQENEGSVFHVFLPAR